MIDGSRNPKVLFAIRLRDKPGARSREDGKFARVKTMRCGGIYRARSVIIQFSVVLAGSFHVVAQIISRRGWPRELGHLPRYMRPRPQLIHSMGDTTVGLRPSRRDLSD